MERGLLEVLIACQDTACRVVVVVKQKVYVISGGVGIGVIMGSEEFNGSC